MMFSVVMPLFNKAAFVVAAVRSILAQEIKDLEVIVVDDGSTDDSVQRLNLIIDSRLTILRHSNAGVAAARNKGIAAVQGAYICFLDADDLWAPDHLTKIMELIDEDPDAIAWATGYTEIDQFPCVSASFGGMRSGSVLSQRFDQRDFMVLWSRRPFFWTGSITVRASTLRELQPCFPPGEHLGEDQDLWFRLSERGHIRFIDVRTSAFYRRNVGNSLTVAYSLEPLPAFIRLIARTSGQAPRERRAASHLFNIHLLHLAWANCLAGRRSAARGFLWTVAPNVRWTYWFRIFVCSLLPVGIVRGALALTRSKRIGKQ
jgi:glycosyltransferase involved in cell wall biosynthesis